MFKNMGPEEMERMMAMAQSMHGMGGMGGMGGAAGGGVGGAGGMPAVSGDMMATMEKTMADPKMAEMARAVFPFSPSPSAHGL